MIKITSFCIFVTLLNIAFASEPQCPAKDGAYPTYIPHEDCDKFYECSNGIPYLFTCPPGTNFHPSINVCAFGDPGNCKNPQSPPVPPTVEKMYGTPCNNNFIPAAFTSICPPEDGDQPVYIPSTDCSRYYECSNGVPVEMCCPPGLEFNPVLHVCDNPENANCNKSEGIYVK